MKEYFISGKIDLHSKRIVNVEKKFKTYFIISIGSLFAFFLCIVVIGVASQLFLQTELMTQYNEQFKGESLETALKICDSEPDDKRDTCYLFFTIFAKHRAPGYDFYPVCEKIESAEWKKVCYDQKSG